MRIYGTKTVPASIRQKTDTFTIYGEPSRPLTADDFEIVPEHEEEQLIEVRCELCGIVAEFFHPRIIDGEECESSLISIQLYKGKSYDNFREVTRKFLKDYWYEVCEACMKGTLVPTLMCLSGVNFGGNREQEEDGENTQLGPPSENEPF